ncbi:MAG: hypothetical protein Q4D62_15075 [Planctomycetia bacterium]|nr:hypothetical protein [Planctomycetia bacterium]
MKKYGFLLFFWWSTTVLLAQNDVGKGNVEKFLRDFPVRLENGEATPQD